MNKTQKFKKIGLFLVCPAVWIVMQWKFGGDTPAEADCFVQAIGISFSSLTEQPGTLVSYAAIHRGWLHLFFNLALYVFFAPALVASENPMALVVTMISGAVTGAAASALYLLPQVDVVVGGDAAIYAVVVASTMVAPGKRGLLSRPKSFFCIALLIATRFPVPVSQNAIDAVPVLEIAGAVAGACSFLVLVSHSRKSDYLDNAFFILLGVWFGNQAWNNGFTLVTDFLDGNLILPWNSGGQWGQWLWTIGGALAVLCICETLELPDTSSRVKDNNITPDTTERYPFVQLEKHEV